MALMSQSIINGMTPWERYQSDLKRSDFVHDPAQAQAIQQLQDLYHQLLEPVQTQPEDRSAVLLRIFSLNKEPTPKAIQGLYFWGGVGRGKTYLIDSFFELLPFREKRRIHFHRFMQMVHKELALLDDVVNPLDVVARKFADNVRVLCFDEFHVSDITDAMLLGGLLKVMFEQGVILVTTSNQAPDDLYAGGLQRQRFLPAIELIKQNTQIVNVDHGIDYRLRVLEQAEIYHTPLDDEADRIMNSNFEHIASDHGTLGQMLEIEGREIETIRISDGVLWCTFSALCEGPRGAADYIEIAREFQTVFISNIPVMSATDDDKARRLMTLIDELYDRSVNLVVSAAEEPAGLYTGDRLIEPFKRTISRLEEMRSHDYLAQPHLP